MPTVVHAIDYASPRRGSFIAALQSLIEMLRDRHDAHSVVVAPAVDASPRWASELAASGADVLFTRRYATLGGLLRSREPAIVHAHFSGYAVPSALAALNGWRSFRLFWHVHSALLEVRGARRLWQQLKFDVLGRAVERVFAVSPAVGDELTSAGVTPSRIDVLHNGIDMHRFREPSPEERRRARGALGLRADDRAVLFFGRDAFVKGADLLAAAVRAVRPAPTILCVAAPTSVRGLLAASAPVVATPELDDVLPLFWAADALAMPSRLEGMPLALLEARATGLPAVVSAIPAFATLAARDEGTLQCDALDAWSFGRGLSSHAARGRIPLADDLRTDYDLHTWSRRILERYALG